MSQELIKIETGIETVEPDQFDSGLDSVGVKPSYVKLVQPTTQKPAGLGELFNVGDWIDGESADVLNKHKFVGLRIESSRIYFPPGGGNTKPICKSDDTVVPSKFVDTPMAATCASCQYGRWGKTVEGKAIPPPCGIVKTLLAVDADTMLPVKISFTKGNIPTVDEFIKSMKKRAMSARARGVKDADLYSFYFTLGSIKAKTTANRNATISYAGDVPVEQIPVFKKYYSLFKYTPEPEIVVDVEEQPVKDADLVEEV